MPGAPRARRGIGPGRRRAAALLAAAALLSCGYRLSQRYAAQGGVTRIHVRTFENHSADPELGAAVTAALREELARRGAEAGADAPAWLEGNVQVVEGGPSTPAAATQRVALELRARLMVGSELRSARLVRRDGDYLGGADALEAEARRAVELRKLAQEAAREVLRLMED